MTTGEIAMAKTIYKTAIDYSKVKIHNHKYWIQTNNWFMTPNGEIYAPDNSYEEDYSAANISKGMKAIIIHELAHVWQHQNNIVNVKLHGIFTAIEHLFDYGKAYAYDLSPGKDLLEYTMEQQGAIIEDYFRLINGESPRNARATPNSARDKQSYEFVLAKFIKDPSYAKK